MKYKVNWFILTIMILTVPVIISLYNPESRFWDITGQVFVWLIVIRLLLIFVIEKDPLEGKA